MKEIIGQRPQLLPLRDRTGHIDHNHAYDILLIMAAAYPVQGGVRKLKYLLPRLLNCLLNYGLLKENFLTLKLNDNDANDYIDKDDDDDDQGRLLCIIAPTTWLPSARAFSSLLRHPISSSSSSSS